MSFDFLKAIPVVGDIIDAGVSLFNANKAKNSQEHQLAQQMNEQREYATHGIRWKVEDAKLAGLHPLAALGANTMSYTPMSVGTPSSFQTNFGQSLARAASIMKTKEEKELDKIVLAKARAELDNMNLQNIGLLKQVTDNRSAGLPSKSNPLGISGQNSVVYEEDLPGVGAVYTPPKIPKSRIPGVREGQEPMERDVLMPGGFSMRIPTEEAGDALESSIYGQLQYNAMKGINYLKGWKDFIFSEPKNRNDIRTDRPAAPKGYEYRYNPLYGGYMLRKKKGSSRLYDVPEWAKRYRN